MSASGQYQRATFTGPTGMSGQGNNCVSFYTDNFTTDWYISTSTSGDARFGKAIAMSASGQYQTIVTDRYQVEQRHRLGIYGHPQIMAQLLHKTHHLPYQRHYGGDPFQ